MPDPDTIDLNASPDAVGYSTLRKAASAWWIRRGSSWTLKGMTFLCARYGWPSPDKSIAVEIAWFVGAAAAALADYLHSRAIEKKSLNTVPQAIQAPPANPKP